MSAQSIIERITPAFLRRHLAGVEHSMIRSRLAQGAFWSVLGTGMARGLAVLATILVARILHKEGFGEFGMILSTVGMFQVFAGFGMGLTATKYVAEFRRTDPAKAGRVLAMSRMVALVGGFLAATVLLAAAPWLATHTLANPGLSGLLQVSSILLLLGAVNAEQNGALAGFEAFRQIMHINLIAGLLSFPLLALGAYWFGLEGAVWGSVGSMAVNAALNHRAIVAAARGAAVPLPAWGGGSEWRILWRFSVPAVLSGVMVGPVLWACNAILANQTGGYAELGAYNAVLRLKQFPEMVLGALLGPLLPILCDQFGRNDVLGYGKTLSGAYLVSCMVVAPLALLFVAAPEILLLPYGQTFAGYENVVRWLTLHLAIVAIAMPISSVLASMGHMWFGFLFNASWAAVLLALSLLLVPRYGAAGLAAAVSLAQLLTGIPCFVYLYLFRRQYQGGYPFYRMAAIVMGLFAITAAVSCRASHGGGLIACGVSIVVLCAVAYRVFRRRRRGVLAAESPEVPRPLAANTRDEG